MSNLLPIAGFLMLLGGIGNLLIGLSLRKHRVSVWRGHLLLGAGFILQGGGYISGLMPADTAARFALFWFSVALVVSAVPLMWWERRRTQHDVCP